MDKVMFSSNSNEWATPQEFFDALDARHHFTLDPCATKENAKCKKFYTIAENGLLQDWGGGVRVLQPSIRQGYSQVGREGVQRNEEAEHKGCYAYPCENGHELLAQVDIPSRNAYRLCQRAYQVRQQQELRTFPICGGGVPEYGLLNKKNK